MCYNKVIIVVSKNRILFVNYANRQCYVHFQTRVSLMTEEFNSQNSSNEVKKDPIALIERLKDGDTSAFDELSKMYAPLVNSVYTSFETTVSETVGVGDVSELSSELSYALYRAATVYDVERGNVTFGRYAKRCLTNCAISYLRKARSAKKKQEKALHKLENELRSARHQHTFDVYFNDCGNMDKNELLQIVSEVLSPYEYEVFNKYLEGMSATTIAAQLNTDAKSVNNAIYRGKRKVAGILKLQSADTKSDK